MMVLACIAVVSSSLAQENLTALIKKVSPSVVLVITYDEEGEELSGGSGFFISEAGDVITNRHVIQGAYHAEVKTADEKVYDVKEILAEDKECDLIRLSVDIPRDAVHVLGISDSLPEVGERVIVVGNPLGLEQTVSDGIVSAVREIPAFGNIIQITAPISSGSSGSPVVNMKGEVIGVASFQMVEGQNLNFAIPGERVAELTSGKGQTFAERKAAITEEWVSSAEGLYWQGMHYFWVEDYEKALPYFEDAVEKNPSCVEAYSKIGDCKCDLGLYSGAVEAYKKAIIIDSNYIDAYAGLGWAYGNLSLYSEEVEAYEQAIRVEPDNADAYYNLGAACAKLGSYSKAIKAYKQAIGINPDDADAHCNLGAAYANLGLYSEAIDAYEQAIYVKPAYAQVYYNLAIAYGNLKRHGEAIEAYKQAIRIDPDYADAHFNLGLAYGNLGRYSEQIEAYKQAIRINPDDAYTYYNLGLTYVNLESYSKAIEAYKQAIRINPDNAYAHYNLGVAYANLGRYSEEIEAYKQAICFNSDYAYAHYGLGLAYLRTKDTGSALQEYKILKGLDVGLANRLFNLIYP